MFQVNSVGGKYHLMPFSLLSTALNMQRAQVRFTKHFQLMKMCVQVFDSSHWIIIEYFQTLCHGMHQRKECYGMTYRQFAIYLAEAICLLCNLKLNLV